MLCCFMLFLCSAAVAVAVAVAVYRVELTPIRLAVKEARSCPTCPLAATPAEQPELPSAATMACSALQSAATPRQLNPGRPPMSAGVAVTSLQLECEAAGLNELMFRFADVGLRLCWKPLSMVVACVCVCTAMCMLLSVMCPVH